MMFLDPKIAHAESFSTIAANPTIHSIGEKIIQYILTPLITFMFLLAGVVFFWGVFGLIAHADDPKARKDATNHILWGVVGFFIMLSAYGIISLIGNTVTGSNPFL